jgi:hypothetical protein
MAEKVYSVECRNSPPPKKVKFFEYIYTIASSKEEAEKYAKRILKVMDDTYVYKYFNAIEVEE